jgi:hypothetical protein
MMTPKQQEILRCLIRRNFDGSLLDIYQLLEKVPGASRAAMMCSIKHMMGHSLVEEKGKVLREGRMRSVFAATGAGYALMKGAF